MYATRKNPRRLVLIDVENVCQGQLGTSFAFAAKLVERVIGVSAADQVVVAACARSFRHIGWGHPGWRYLVRNGQDGAEIALIEVLNSEHVKSRFDHVVIVSGDHRFTPETARLTAHGIHVTVVAWRGGLAASLRLAANEVRWLEPDTQKQRVKYLPSASTLMPNLGRKAA